MPLITTPRTTLRELTTDDADFVRALLNEPSFLQFIGDRGVRTSDDAADFIETRYRQSYREHGYGLHLMSRRDTGAPVGLCGFVRREALEHPDLGFALVPAAEGHGLAYEAAAATLDFGHRTLGLTPVLAVVQDDNHRSRRLLERLGFRENGHVLLPGDTAALLRYRWDAPSQEPVLTE